MMKDTREEMLNAGVMRAKQHLEKMGYTLAHIAIYGSQNYELDVYTEDYQSDVDYKAVIVPSLRDLVNDSKPESTTIDFEGGKIDLKDIRVFTDTLVKCNPAYLETLYSDFSWSSHDFSKIKDLRDALVFEMAPFFARAAHGMAMEKLNALCHPYPSIKDKIDKYGYDPKQLHHIYRLGFLMKSVYEGKFQLVPEDWEKELCLKLKLEPMPLETADHMATMGASNCASWRENIEKKYPPKFGAKQIITQHARDLVYNSIINGVQVIQ